MVIKNFFKRFVVDDELKEKLDFLKKVSLFSGLGKSSLAEVYSIAYEKNYSAGEVIFDEGQTARALYIVKSGQVKITKRDRELVVLKEGDFLGEMSLLEEISRTAKAVAVVESRLLLIYKVKFDGLIEDDPSVGVGIIRNLAKILSARLRATSESYADVAEVGSGS